MEISPCIKSEFLGVINWAAECPEELRWSSFSEERGEVQAGETSGQNESGGLILVRGRVVR